MSDDEESGSEAAPDTETVTYDDGVVRYFAFATAIYAVVGMLVGATIALQLAFPDANVHPMLSFGRLRPLHTNAVIFAFVGNMVFAGIYYSTQRLTKARMASDVLSRVHFWGWQAIIVAAVVTLPLGITTSKEYAELEWPIDIAIALVWVAFAVNFFWTLAKRREKQLYVALWFYIASIVTITVLHVVNSLAVPYAPFHSYPVFAGVQDALVQWWYGHNAVAFFLTTPVLGIMYYFLPKAAERPVFSYRLSIVHFWSLVFLYIWAGPHHLLYTTLPEWAQSLGMVFSLMLWAPSWGGMLNGLLTLRGAWDRVRRDPVLKFFAAGVTFYGMSTFEGPLLSIRSVSGLAHYTDWIVAHVHAGGLGWNGFMAAGMLYWMVPRLFGTKLYSTRAADLQFWICTFGILLYAGSMWAGGITQGLMWRATTADGGLLYPSFVETVIAIRPLYWMRLVGGTLYLIGFCVMLWNLVKTARAGKAVNGTIVVPVREPSAPPKPWASIVFAPPVLLSVAVTVVVSAIAFTSATISTVLIVVAAVIAIAGTVALQARRVQGGQTTWHALLEGRAAIFTVLTLVSVLVGGIFEIVPLVVTGQEDLRTTQNTPYTPLELEGRDVYIAEGCYTCHSQMIRPFTWETARYGRASLADDSIFDHPFQWGSKRNGPDLAREGGRRSDHWHAEHMVNPRRITPGSIMPSYAHLAQEPVDFRATADKLRAMRTVGVPYTPEQIAGAERDATSAAEAICDSVRASGGAELEPNTKLVALIAYLQRLGANDAPSASLPSTPALDRATAHISRATER